MIIASPPSLGSQKRLDPHTEQNPRRASGDDSYHRRPSEETMDKSPLLAPEAATK
jgi:hypothetical protein